MQTATGPNAGNVVLWMQPDGTLNPSAEPGRAARPVRQRRVLLAGAHRLGARRGLRRLPRRATRRSPRFLQAAPRPRGRGAATVRCSTRYGSYLQIDGRRTPGLAGRGRRRRSRRGGARAGRLRRGRRPGAGPARAAPALRGHRRDGRRRRPALAVRRACCPWALSRSRLARLGLADAGRPGRGAGDVLGDARLLAALRLATRSPSTPWMLTSGGPDNGRLPTRWTAPRSPTASTRGCSRCSRRPTRRPTGSRELAGVVAAWFFGANASGAADLRPGHRSSPFDGVAGRRHGQPQLRCRVDDPRAARRCSPRRAPGASLRSAADRDRRGPGRHRHAVQAEDAALTGDATAVKPASLWTGESLYGGAGYAALRRRQHARTVRPRHRTPPRC